MAIGVGGYYGELTTDLDDLNLIDPVLAVDEARKSLHARKGASMPDSIAPFGLGAWQPYPTPAQGVERPTLAGLATGLSANLAYKFMPSRFSERLRAMTTGVVLGITTFILVLIAIRFFYVEYQIGPGSFLGVAYYGLPFLIVNSLENGKGYTLTFSRDKSRS